VAQYLTDHCGLADVLFTFTLEAVVSNLDPVTDYHDTVYFYRDSALPVSSGML